MEVKASSTITLVRVDDGADGLGIATTTVEYAKSTSGTSAPEEGWDFVIPDVDAGEYQWTRVTFLYTDGTTIQSYSVGKMGATGLDGQSAYEAAIEAGFTGTRDDFLAALGYVEQLPETVQTVSQHTTELTSLGMTVTSIEGEFLSSGRVSNVERKVTQIEAGEIKLWGGEETLAEILANMTQQLSSLQEGGSNFLKNSNLGAAGTVDGTFWSNTGMLWLDFERRFNTWATFKNMNYSWIDFQNNAR